MSNSFHQAPSKGLILESLRSIGDVPLTLRAELDQRTISFQELLELRPGSLLVLSRPTGENIDLYAGDVMIGSGEILVVDTTMAVRIADVRDRPVTAAAGDQAPQDLDDALESHEEDEEERNDGEQQRRRELVLSTLGR